MTALELKEAASLARIRHCERSDAISPLIRGTFRSPRRCAPRDDEFFHTRLNRTLSPPTVGTNHADSNQHPGGIGWPVNKMVGGPFLRNLAINSEAQKAAIDALIPFVAKF